MQSNTACHLASLLQDAAKVRLYTALGKDAWGDTLREKYRSSGVFLHDHGCEKVSSGVCVVLSGCKDRAFLTSPGAVAFLDRHVIQSIGMCDHLHVGGLFSMPKLQIELAESLKNAKKKNPNLTVSRS